MPAASQVWEGAVQVGTDSRMRLGEDSVQGNTGLLAELDGRPSKGGGRRASIPGKVVKERVIKVPIMHESAMSCF